MSDQLNGNRPLPWDRDQLGRFVREAWVRWATTQPNPKPSWLVGYDRLREPDKEADRQIGEWVGRWTLIGDAAHAPLRVPRTGQSRRHSLIETCLSTAIGYVVAVSSQIVVFPLVGIHVAAETNLEIGAIMTVVSVVRGFWVRRLFNHLHVKGIL